MNIDDEILIPTVTICGGFLIYKIIITFRFFD